MSVCRVFKITFIGLGIAFLALGVSFALEDDGFGAARKIQSSHFAVYYSPQIDAASLAQQLNIRPADEILVGKTSTRGNSSPEQLAAMLDTLFMRVCDILDMQLYSFQGNIKICQDYNQLNQIYRNIFDHDLGNRKSFYINDLNTVYISAESFQREILGHEIAHAIISHYFVVLPSVKIQEVLAGYVEYQLRKSE
jgi:hypothetical protein